jgi:DNA-binding CsgD family transcriptional regulator
MLDVQKTLSEREQQIAFYKIQDMSNREIASELAIAERTVRFHINNIYRKLKVPNAMSLDYTYGSQIHIPRDLPIRNPFPYYLH